MTIIIFIIVLALLIFVHELGHFLIAKACGIRVDAFALGFGPKILSKKIGEVVYSLNLIPFGGYVKIFGENPDDESINGPDIERSFVHKPKWQQISVLIAGIVFNFIFAWILIVFAFLSGAPASIESYSQYSDRFTNNRIIISSISQNSPAEKAGFIAGDQIIGKSISEIQELINNNGDKNIKINIIRNGSDNKEISVIPEKGIIDNRYAIGISMDNVATLKLPIHLAIYEGIKFTCHMIWQTIIGIIGLIGGVFDGSSKLSSITGPVGIAGLVGDAFKVGFNYLLMFTAIISINLGVLNLVPFPALDGGRILFTIIEIIIRKPIKPEISNTVNAIGFALLLLLMIVVTYRDIVKLF